MHGHLSCNIYNSNQSYGHGKHNLNTGKVTLNLSKHSSGSLQAPQVVVFALLVLQKYLTKNQSFLFCFDFSFLGAFHP